MSAHEALRRLGGPQLVACDGCGQSIRHPSYGDPWWMDQLRAPSDNEVYLDDEVYFVCSNRCRIRVRTRHLKRRPRRT